MDTFVESVFPDPPTVEELVSTGEVELGDDYNTYPSPRVSLEVAHRLVEDLFTVDGNRTLVFWRKDWWIWDGTSWVMADSDLDVKTPVWHRLAEVTYKNGGEVAEWAPTTPKVSALMEPLQVLTRLPDSAEAPTWLGDSTGKPVALIALKNGLLDISTRELHPLTPAYFTTWSLDFDYVPGFTSPVWEKFLGEVFAHDPNAALALQEFAGYLISGRLDMHKALLIVGLPGGGKGTISRAFHQLMGRGNVVSPSLGQLGSEFGGESLVGKPLAVIEDARAAENSKAGGAVERLLNIVGEDEVSLNRKGRSYWTGTLPTRFMIISNEVPQFLDSSGAIMRRFISMKLEATFKDKPDKHLGKKISNEIAGVFNWALDGLARLEEQGSFTTPDTMGEMSELMADMGSPLMRFLDEHFIVTGDKEHALYATEVFNRYREWAKEQGGLVMTRDKFSQRLVAADPRVTYVNTDKVNGVKVRKARRFFGLKLNPF